MCVLGVEEGWVRKTQRKHKLQNKAGMRYDLSTALVKGGVKEEQPGSLVVKSNEIKCEVAGENLKP